MLLLREFTKQSEGMHISDYRGPHFSGVVDGFQIDHGRCFSVIVDDLWWTCVSDFLDLHRLPQAGRLDEGQHSCGFCCVLLPPENRVRMRTTNSLECANKELKLKTRVATLFPKAAGFLRLIRALLAEQDEYEGLSTSRYRHQVSRLGFEMVS